MCNVKVNLLRWLIYHDVVTMTDYMDLKVYNVTVISIANLTLQLIYGMVLFVSIILFIFISGNSSGIEGIPAKTHRWKSRHFCQKSRTQLSGGSSHHERTRYDIF